jgi:rRNA processing protein Gar1
MTHVTTTAARVGDLVEVVGHRVGDSARNGEIVEVLGEPTKPHFQVRWEDGHVSVLFAASDVVISRPDAES